MSAARMLKPINPSVVKPGLNLELVRICAGAFGGYPNRKFANARLMASYERRRPWREAGR